MPQRRVDVADDTFVGAAPERIRASLTDERWLDGVWPHLQRTVVRDRGVKGVRWTVTGQVEGDMEVWIEPFWDGAIVHHYLRGTATAGAPRDVTTRHTLRWKRAVHALKDALERTEEPAAGRAG
ncbi:polyketide cyclase / dehydrase and lipid transport [Knoellia koreensis]|uniref:Polyketide cyclase / dehydrase and lipid transport n=1 Tax=Knoellia koreensis TaxID=2730921 RepID=A0A849H634_9MICO|nr:polyketide cyclase / dehydrase and lipid transport [Knoellia sp. DB2414S]NNM45246.1 polyketide cyclase / dehydrase and lipid transport [Knoellia sp. DB2414S]